MNKGGIRIKGRLHTFAGPSCWKELSDEQSIAVMRVRAQVSEDSSCLFPLLKTLYGISYAQQRWLFDERYLRRQGMNNEQIDQTLRKGQVLLNTLTWIGQDDADAVFPAQFRLYSYQYGSPLVLVKQLLDRRRYYGPAAGLKNCTFAEFMFADVAFQKRDWPKLAAILFRPAGSDPADARQPFDRHQVEARAKRFAQLDEALLERIAFAYACSLMSLKKHFRFVFQESGEESTATGGKQANWLDVAISMVKLDATRVAEVEKLNLYLALKVLNEQIRQNEETKAHYDKLNKK